ncbi:unnamed protein product [Mucor hiemalis]
MSNIRIQAIDVTYAQLLCDLGRKTFDDTFGSHNDPANMEACLDANYSKEIQQKELEDPLWYTIMAFDNNDTPVGLAQLKQTAEGEQVYPFIGDTDAIELNKIYVDKDCIGSGVGKLLLDHCIEKAKELNKKTLWLGVWEFNPRAIKFYEKQGFYRVGEHIFKVGDQDDTDHIMIKKL